MYARAQRWAEMAWKPFLEKEGVRFSYIFYPKADGEHDGVVIKLENTNAYPVRYRFIVVFRSEDTEVQQEVSGTIPAQKMITGDRHGLFWIPFRNGKHIYELGIRGWRITPVNSS